MGTEIGMAPDAAFGPHFTALLDRARADGSFALTGDGPTRPDATAWAAMALFAAGRAPQVVAGARNALAALQAPDGRVPLFPSRPEAAWPTMLAMAAWLPDAAFGANLRAAAAWLVGHPGVSWARKKDSPSAHDPSLKGWNWIEGTHSWVEPTALAMLVLAAVTPEPREALDEATCLLLDRQLPDGGWNYGNTRVFHHTLLPMPESTGHALAALAGRVPREAVAASLAYLSGPRCAAISPCSISSPPIGASGWRGSLFRGQGGLRPCFSFVHGLAISPVNPYLMPWSGY